IDLDDTEDNEGSQVRILGSLGTVTQGEDELQQQETKVAVFDDCVDNGSRGGTKGETLVTVAIARGTDQIHNDRRCKPVRCKREPSQKCVENVVQHLNVQEEHANNVMPTLVHPTK